jgi:hypothetical protein
VVAAAGLAIVAGMSRIEHLTERAIALALAEPNEKLAVARVAFLAHGNHAALDAAIDACLARTERTLYTPLAGHQLPGPGPLRGPADPQQPATASAGRSNGGKGRAPGSSRGPRLGNQPG